MSVASVDRYEIHGVSLAVRCPDAELARAVAYRLRGLRADPPPRADAPTGERADLELELRPTAEGQALEPPAGRARLVYEPPHGELRYYPDVDTLYAELEGLRLLCRAGEGFACIESDRFLARRRYLASHPLTTIALMELLKRRQRYAMHAGCVSDGRLGVLLCGPRGAGKSTLSLALALRGLELLSDDTVFLDGARPAELRPIAALGFDDALGITPQTAARFARDLPGASRAAPIAGFPKRLARIEELGLRRAARCTPVAVVFPEISAQPASRLVELAPREAFLRLVPDVLLTEPHSTQCHLDALGRLSQQVCYHRLEFASDVARAAELVAGLLESAEAPSGMPC